MAIVLVNYLQPLFSWFIFHGQWSPCIRSDAPKLSLWKPLGIAKVGFLQADHLPPHPPLPHVACPANTVTA